MDATDFAVILPKLSSVNERNVTAGVPEPARRYLSLILAGLRPDGTPLPGRAPADAELRAAMATKGERGPAATRCQKSGNWRQLRPDDGHNRGDQRLPNQEGVDSHAHGEADRPDAPSLRQC